MINNQYRIQDWIRIFVTTERNNSLLKVLREKAYWRTPQELSWEDISSSLSVPVEKLKELNPKIAFTQKVREKTTIVYPGKALGVSYSEEGLKYVCNNRGDMLYFKDALYSDINSWNSPTLKRSNKVYVEDFVPMDHIVKNHKGEYLDKNNQTSEIMATDKALRLYYVSSGDANSPDKELVYSTK